MSSADSKEIMNNLKKARLKFGDLEWNPLLVHNYGVQYTVSTAKESGVKLHVPVAYDGKNYENFLHAIGDAMKKVPGAASTDGVCAIKMLETNTNPGGAQMGKTVTVYLGENLADHPESLNKFCNALYENMAKNEVTLMNIPKGTQYNLNVSDIPVEGTSRKIFLSFDGNVGSEYVGKWEKLREGYKGSRRSIPDEVADFYKNLEVRSQFNVREINPLNQSAAASLNKNVSYDMKEQLNNLYKNKRIQKIRVVGSDGKYMQDGFRINMTDCKPEEIERMKNYLNERGCGARLSHSKPGYVTVQEGAKEMEKLLVESKGVVSAGKAGEGAVSNMKEQLNNLYKKGNVKKIEIVGSDGKYMQDGYRINMSDCKPEEIERMKNYLNERGCGARLSHSKPGYVTVQEGAKEMEKLLVKSTGVVSAEKAGEGSKIAKAVKGLNNLLREGSNAGKAGEGVRSAFGAARRLINTAKAVQNAEEAAKAAKGVGLVQKGLRALFK